MRKLFLAVSICLFINVNAQTQKEEKIKVLLELTGGIDAVKQMTSTFIQSAKTQYSYVPKAYWDKFESKMNTNELINLVIPIYDKYYTEEEISQLIEFYKTPLGQKVKQVTPNIAIETAKVGQEWGIRIAQEVIKEIEEEKENNQN